MVKNISSKKMKKQITDWEKMSAQGTSHKWLLPKIYEEHLKLNNKKASPILSERSSKKMLCCAHLLSCVRLFATLRAVASQSMEILQARILEWVAMPSSKGPSQPRNQTQVSHIAGRFFTSWTAREAHQKRYTYGK